LFEGATNFLYLFNMTVTMAKQGGNVQLKQSDMCPALNLGKMAKGGFLRTAIQEKQ
jgi:hypothetical protein